MGWKGSCGMGKLGGEGSRGERGATLGGKLRKPSAAGPLLRKGNINISCIMYGSLKHINIGNGGN